MSGMFDDIAISRVIRNFQEEGTYLMNLKGCAKCGKRSARIVEKSSDNRCFVVFICFLLGRS